MRKITKRSVAVVAAAVVAVGGGAAAWAAWTLSGAGDTTATAASVQPLTVGAVDGLGLSPGVASDIQFKVSNPNKFAIKITGVTITNIKAPGGSKCPETNVAKQAFDLPADPLIGPAGAAPTEKAFTLANAIKMNQDAADACQGAKFTISLSLAAITAA